MARGLARGRARPEPPLWDRLVPKVVLNAPDGRGWESRRVAGVMV